MDDKGNRTGFGTCVYKNGSKYVGEWKDNMRHGQGKITQPNGAHYEGQWLNDKKHGIGKEVYHDGEIIKGAWNEGRIDGKAEYMKLKNKAKGFKPGNYVKDMLVKDLKSVKWWEHVIIPVVLMHAVALFIYLAKHYESPIYYLGAACAYIINLLESVEWSNVSNYLSNQQSLTDAKDKVAGTKNNGPRITWHIKNYGHKEEDKHKDDDKKDSKDKKEEKKSKKKVVTHEASKDFDYSQFVDQSPPDDALDSLRTMSHSRLKQKLYIKFSPDALKEYQRQKNEFI